MDATSTFLGFLSNAGEMGRRIAAHDWRATPLGPIDAWPQSLRTALSIVLESKFATYMAWGEELIGLYNDPYIPALGKKDALGVPFEVTWAEAWGQVGPLARRAMQGDGSFFENLPIQVERNGYPELTYFTFSYSPVRDESNGVGGILCTVVETTGSVVAEQRRRFQLELADGLRGRSDPAEITAWACEVLGKKLGAVRVGYANIDQAGNGLDIRQGWHDGTVETVVGQVLPLDSFGPAVLEALSAGRTVRVGDIVSDPLTATHPGVYSALRFGAILIVPLLRDSRLILVVAIGASAPRHWRDDEVVLAEETAERTRSAVERALAERALSDSLERERDRLRLLFQQAPGMMAIMRGPQHTFELVNDAYLDLIGGRLQVGMPVREALPELAGQGFFALLDRVYATGEPFVGRGLPVELQRSANEQLEKRFLDFVYQPIVEADGRVGGIFLEGSDVTDQVQAQRELERVNHELRDTVRRQEDVESRQAFMLQLSDSLRTLESADDILVAVTAQLGRKLGVSRVVYAEVDDDARILYLRREWTAGDVPRVTGNTKLLDDFGPDMAAQLRRGQVVVNHDVALDPRTASHTQAYLQIGVQADLLIPMTRLGKLRMILAFHHAQPHRWTEEEIQFGRDMAERTWLAVDAARTQADLRLERDQSQSVLDSMAEGFALFDENWTVLRVNAGGLRLIQRDADDVVGHNHWDVFPELRGTPIESLYRRVRMLRHPESIDLHYERTDSGAIWIEVRAYPALQNGVAAFFRDITERKQAEEKLREGDRRKDEFLAMLAHELRNPLAPISAAADLLRMAQLEPARVRQTSEIITRQVRHMTSLVDDLMDVSRVTRGLVSLERKTMDARDIVADAVEQVRPLIEARRHALEVAAAREPAYVIGDQKRLVQVLTNLLNNAAKYTPEGGRIEVHMATTERDVIFAVRDNGIGMAGELIARAFELFAQAERTPDRSQGGLGIGLALVRSLVELHYGSVVAHSAGLGAGCEFTVRLPRARKDDYFVSVTRDQAAGHGPGQLRILVVDDNADAASMLAMFLEASGHEVSVENSSRQALERAVREAPDVCLLDIGLPDMDGIELAQHLRADPRTAGAVLIAVTGYGQEQDRRNTEAAGFAHHLVKPIDTVKLVGLLGGLVKK